MNQSTIDVDSVESAKIDKELSGSPDEMADDVSNADSADTDTLKSDHSEGDSDPAEEIVDPSKDAADENGSAPDGDDSPPDEAEPESGTPWELALTADSTSLSEITGIIIGDDSDLLGDSDLKNEIDAFLSGETKFKSDKHKLRAGQEILRKFYAQFNQAWSGVKGTFAEYAVSLGIFLIALKSLMKACGEKWEPWAAKNLPFMSERTRQAFMQLANVPGINNHLHFGKERLLLLASATKGKGGEDPIGDFLKTYDLAFNPEDEIDLDAYKYAVDLALDYERLKKAGINIKMESLKKHRADGKKVDASLIKVLTAVQASTGDPNKHLTDPPKDGPDKDEKKAKSFQKSATSLAGTITWISSHKEFIKHVDVSMIDELTTELAKLKQLVIETEAKKSKQ